MHDSSTQPAQAFQVGDSVQITSETQPQTYVISEAQIKKPERVWTYALKQDGQEDIKWIEEAELKQ